MAAGLAIFPLILLNIPGFYGLLCVTLDIYPTIMKKNLLPLLYIAATSTVAVAQHTDMTQWGTDRGYHEGTGAPYYRYEAEKNSGTNGTLLAQTDDQQYLQSEASNQQAVTLRSDGQYVRWTNDTGDANGLTIRFSVPAFNSARVAVYAGNDKLGEFEVNANHSWQWNNIHQGERTNKPEYYSTHGQQKAWARMRFDEEMCLLSRDILRNETFEIRKVSGADVTVDFVEIEKAEYLSEQDAKACYGNDITYIGPGVHEGDLNGVKTVGAGIFYTQFTGKCNSGWVAHVRFSGTQNQRYPSMGNDEGPGTYNDIKCVNGGGYWEHCLFEHYTCGAWMGGSTATFKHCRIRNNYADGVNFWNGSSNCVVERCNFRNNGDDDIASWANTGHSVNHNISYTTCEHNWRASSLAFFGGGNHVAKNMLIKDCMESGIRCVSDFAGDGFRDSEPHKYYDISIVHCGCTYGTPGRDGDFWGVDEAALHIEASNNGNIWKQEFHNIDIYHPRGDAVLIAGRSDKSVNNILFDKVRVHGLHGISYSNPDYKKYYAFNFENVTGSATFNSCGVEDIMPAQVTNFQNEDQDILQSGTGSNGFNLTANPEVRLAQSFDIPEGVELLPGGISWEKDTQTRAADDEIKAGDKLKISLLVANTGAELPSNIPVYIHVKVNDETLGVSKLDGMASDEYKTLTYSWTAKPGKADITATIDPNNQIPDAVSQRELTKKINVRERAWNDFTFDRVNGVDLAIHDILWRTDESAEFGHGPINTGAKVQWAAVVYNRGYNNITRDDKIGIAYQVDGKNWAAGLMSWNDDIKNLNAGEIKLFPTNGGGSQATGNDEIYRFWDAAAGSHSITAIADDSGNISEADESNNSYTYPGDITVPYAGITYYPESEVDSPDNLDESLPIITGIHDMPCPSCNDNLWYGIDGSIYTARPQAHGIYIRNGRKYVQ